jgi:hypothetical protein
MITKFFEEGGTGYLVILRGTHNWWEMAEI